MAQIDIKTRIDDWPGDKVKLEKIRRIVFIEEQQVPEELEWDEYDELSTHFLATVNGKVIANARLKPDGQIGRMAVLAEYRHLGIGGKLLRLVLKNALSQNFKQVYLHAQVDAIPFYEKQKFIASSDIFYEANIPHREMWRKIC